MRLRLAGSVVAACTLFAPTVVQGDCKCRYPEKDDKTRWVGNQAVVLVPEEHLRELHGIVEIFGGQLLNDVLAEVFDKPDYLVSSKPWNEHPEQNRLRACVTSADGKFCFRNLPSGTYELRISRDQGSDVTHVYAEIARKAGNGKPLRVRMQIGT